MHLSKTLEMNGTEIRTKDTEHVQRGFLRKLGNNKKDCLKKDVQMDVLLYYVQEYIQQGRQRKVT